MYNLKYNYVVIVIDMEILVGKPEQVSHFFQLVQVKLL